MVALKHTIIALVQDQPGVLARVIGMFRRRGFNIASLATPSATNPLGIKGIAELPTVAAPSAVANAVLDALSTTATHHIDIPLTPEKVWRAFQKGR